MSNRPRRVFISVAEDSADRHAELLLRAAKTQLTDVEFVGFCGPRMQAAGAVALNDLTGGAAMLGAALSKRKVGIAALQQAQEYWARESVDLFLPMDSSLLHLPMAAQAKAAGLPVLYYIAPQTWATRAYRNKKISAVVDRLACILPFEEEYFRTRGINAQFVGHPLFERLAAEQESSKTADRIFTSDGRAKVALLPGSRAGVIQKMLPILLAVRDAMSSKIECVISCADERRRDIIDSTLRESGALDVRVYDGPVQQLIAACDLALVTSGTATLNVAAAHKPMVVVYHPGRLLAWGHAAVGPFLLGTRYLSLVNILAGKKIVPEYMTRVPDVGMIARSADQLISDESLRSWTIDALKNLTSSFADQQPSRAVCDEIAALLAG